MAKYGSGLSVNDVCELELKEMEGILNKYNVSEEDKNNLMDMIEEAYFQLSESYACSRVLEKHIGNMPVAQFGSEIMEEKQKYPFVSRRDKEEIE